MSRGKKLLDKRKYANQWRKLCICTHRPSEHWAYKDKCLVASCKCKKYKYKDNQQVKGKVSKIRLVDLMGKSPDEYTLLEAEAMKLEIIRREESYKISKFFKGRHKDKTKLVEKMVDARIHLRAFIRQLHKIQEILGLSDDIT